MATQGPSNPTAASGTGWTNAAGIEGSATFANETKADSTSVTQYLIGTGFGFSIPVGATTNGITLSLVRKVSGSGIDCNTQVVELRYSGATLGTGKTNATLWTTSNVTETYGSGSDVWSASLTPAIVNDSTFGAAIKVLWNNTSGSNRTFDVQDYLITVTYTTASGVTLCQTSTFGF